MRVAIDTTPLQTGHNVRGVGYYTRRLTEAVQQIDKENEYISFSRGKKIPICDLVHYPYFDFFFLTLPFLKRSQKRAVTIFDVIPLIFPDQFKPGIKGALTFKIQKYLLDRNVNKIITISECSKKDIQKYLGISEQKIVVTYLAPDRIFKKINDWTILNKIRDKYNLPKQFILYVGDINYNKNLSGLFQVLSKISIPLVIVGQAAIEKNLREANELTLLADNLGISERISKLGFIPDSDLVSIYNLALAYIQPSFYEGFGLPVLEAMACGCPVLCSSTSSLPEIGSDAAIYFDPASESEMFERITKIIDLFVNNQKNYQALKLKSINHAKSFSWEKTAQETISIYKNLVQ